MPAKKTQSKSTGTKRTTRKKPPGTKQGHTPDNVVQLEVVAGGAGEQLERPKLAIELGKTAQARWDAFWESPLAPQTHPADHGALVRWIEHVQEREEVKATIDRLGMTVEGSTGQIRMNPMYTRLSELEKLIADGEREFGMTPLARNRLGYAMGQAALTANEVNKIAREAAGRSQGAGEETVDDLQEVIDAEGFEEFESPA